MRPSKALLKPLQKRVLYLTTALLWLSGALWLYYKYFGQVQGDYGLQAHPAQPVLLEIHGAAAIAFLMIFGILLDRHVPEGWKQNRQRPSGVLVITFCSILILTGWGLYYVSHDALRHAVSLVHSGAGVVVPFLLILHIVLGRRKPIRKED